MATTETADQELDDSVLAKRLQQANTRRQTRAVSRIVSAGAAQRLPIPARPLLPYGSDDDNDGYDADKDMAQKRRGLPRYVKLDQHRSMRVKVTKKNGSIVYQTPAFGVPKYLVKLPDHKPTILPELDICGIVSVLDSPERFSAVHILHWLKSNEVLPSIKQWYDEVRGDKAALGLMFQDYGNTLCPGSLRLEIADWSKLAQERGTLLPHIFLLAKSAHTIVVDSKNWFEDNFIRYELDEDDKHNIAIAALLVAWHNLNSEPIDGFFSILLDSPLATPKFTYTREVLDMWYIIDERRIKAQENKSQESIEHQHVRRAFNTARRVRFEEPVRLRKRTQKTDESLAEFLAGDPAPPADEPIPADSLTTIGRPLTSNDDVISGETRPELLPYEALADARSKLAEQDMKLRDTTVKLKTAVQEIRLLREALQHCTCQD